MGDALMDHWPRAFHNSAAAWTRSLAVEIAITDALWQRNVTKE
jgi:hypothetical protein